MLRRYRFGSAATELPKPQNDARALDELELLEQRLRLLLDRYERLTGTRELTQSRWRTGSLYEAAGALLMARDSITGCRNWARRDGLALRHMLVASTDVGWAERRLSSAERCSRRCAYCDRVSERPEAEGWTVDEDGMPRCDACSAPEPDTGHDFGVTEPAEDGR